MFVISSLGAAYTHYYALLAVAFLYMMLIPFAIKNKQYLKGLIISYIATIVCYLPWLTVMISRFISNSGSWWLDTIPTVKELVDFLLDNRIIAEFSLFFVILFLFCDLGLLKITFTSNEMKVILSQKKDTGCFRFSNESYWVISGLIMIVGTTAVGLIFSYLIRPFLVYRYIFPLSSSLFLIIAYSISRMEKNKIISLILITLILSNDIPVYIETYKDENMLDRSTAEFLEIVNPDYTTEIVSNSFLFEPTTINCYYPNNPSRLVDNISDVNNNNYKKIFLFWDTKLTDEEIDTFEGNYSVNEIYDGVLGCAVWLYVYELDSIN